MRERNEDLDAAEVVERSDDDLTSEDRAALDALRKRGSHVFDDGTAPKTMVKLHRLGMAERRLMGSRVMYCINKTY